MIYGYYEEEDILYTSREYAPRDEPIWACAYQTANTKRGMLLKCPPIKGIIRDDKFIPFKKTGELNTNREIDYNLRVYADTYEECVKHYNKCVNKRIAEVEEILNEIKADLITAK